MEKLTHWEKQLIKSNCEIITWDHDIIVDYLLAIFNRDKSDLLLQAALDTTKRHELGFVLNYEDLRGTNFGGVVYYNKKKRKFTYITYSDKRNCAVFFSIESKCYYSSYDFYQQIKKKFPFGVSTKKGIQYLMSN